MNKKGFTLVELLAVIVILAVVMLIGGTTVLPMMQKAQKSSLGEEGLSFVKAAENAFQTELIKGANANFKSTDSVCFTLNYLCQNGFYDKGCDGDKYAGSVYVKNTGGNPEYIFFIGNGTYYIENGTKSNYGNTEDTNVYKEVVTPNTWSASQRQYITQSSTDADFNCKLTGTGTKAVYCHAISGGTECVSQTF